MDLLRELYELPSHMYNLAKLEACSEPCQIPKVDLFTITVFNGFKSLFSQKAAPQNT